MGEGQAEKQSQRRLDLLHMAGLKRGAGIMAGERIGRIHMPGAAKGIAGKLVGQNEQRHSPFRRCRPIIVPTRRDRHVKIEKAPAKICVEGRILGEPLVC